ncbi:MAG: glycerophosphodiester phosphodiesterase family protein [Pyrinomonadaceae bacterium]
MKIAILLIVLLAATVIDAGGQTPRPFSIEGHRGARGWVPENTIPSFKKALDMGADTLELDVVVSKDGKLVVSHEPWFAASISLDKDGKPITPETQKSHNIYKMTYAEIAAYDVGSIGNKDYPQQVKMKVAKPLLPDLFREIAAYVRKNKLASPRYNIEIKSSPEGDNSYHPPPAIFAKMVLDAVITARLEKKVIIQAFDERPLQHLRKLNAKIPLALLVSNKDGVEKNLARLGFDPDTYSPHFSLIDVETVASIHSRGMKIIPWTVNEIADLERMKTFDLDGIITDYPDRAVRIFKK